MLFRSLLNRSKGAAVRSPRAQIDKYKYSDFVRGELENCSNLTIIENTVTEISVRGNEIRGVLCKDGKSFYAPAVIITTGTFLAGIMHIGKKQYPCGRIGEPASNELSRSLRQIGLDVKRLKTGTPPRIDAATVNYDRTQIQYGDEKPVPFSFMTDKISRKQISCWITYTNEKIHKLLRDNLHRAPLYTGQITTAGPRYCPSIETKIMRFADRDRHQVFLEPEDENVTTIYCNGISKIGRAHV